MISLVDSINKNDNTNPIIIFTSDHGVILGITYDEMNKGLKKNLHLSYDIFSAIKLRNECNNYLNNNITLVNYFRVITKCLSKKTINQIPNKYYFMSDPPNVHKYKEIYFN